MKSDFYQNWNFQEIQIKQKTSSFYIKDSFPVLQMHHYFH